jgi:2-polyprenyl-3-methyl-5-hydroxy-6-metoxy-1,4-benzoquinol methylase
VSTTTMIQSIAETEILSGERFEFGENWRSFLSVLDGQRIAMAEASLQDMLELSDLRGVRFLDAGSGSGLFSLAARRLGAAVHSFDFDPQSVACTAELKRRYFPDSGQWTIDQGSVLDADYLTTLGAFDVVYSWGVLHHTGAMWQALDNVMPLVADGGKLFISIYNDQGLASRCWRSVKRFYCESSPLTRRLVLAGVGSYFKARSLAARLLSRPARSAAPRARGMSAAHDLKDWVGGYPFEVAKPEQVFDVCRSKGFVLQRLVTCAGGGGCNQFVFAKSSSPSGTRSHHSPRALDGRSER